MRNKPIQADQLIPTSATPPPEAGFYRVDRNTIGVAGELVQMNPATKSRTNATSGAKLSDTTVAASRDLAIDDSGKFLVCNSGSAIALTVQSDATTGWAGTVTIAACRKGVGAVTFAAGAGVTLRGDLATPAQYGSKGIVRIGTNEWTVIA